MMGQEGDYLPHISDPIRRRIAERYVKHELIKLFPSLRDIAAWNIIQGDVAAWFSDSPTLAPLRDFWNGVHAISMGFKLKRLVPWLTSLNIQWNEAEIRTEELWFGSNLEELAQIGPELSARAAKQWYFAHENRSALERARVAHENRSQQTMPRDDLPIIAKQDGERIFAYDGNRRVLRAVLFEKPTIPAVVATPIGQPEIYEHWVPTQVLLELVELYRANGPTDNVMLAATAHTIARLVRWSSAGRIELVRRCLPEGSEMHLLRESISRTLERQGITLP